MKAFNFRLRTLQKLREQSRDKAQRTLAAAIERQTQLQNQKAETGNQLQGLEEHMRGTVKQKRVDVDRMMEGHRHQLSLQAKLAELDTAIDQASEEVVRCRQELVEADRQVKVLDKLHERQLAEHRQRAAQEEVKQLDEAATMRTRGMRGKE